jgi:PAS domain S-box-containing protein
MPAQDPNPEERSSTSNDRYKLVFETSSDAIMLLDEKGFFDCNPATLKIFGYRTKEEFCGRTPADHSPPTQPDGTDSMALANKHIADAYQNGSSSFEWVHKRANGESFPANVLLTAFTLNGKKVIQATVRDITELRRSQAEAEGSASVIEIFQDAIYSLDLSGIVLSWNKGAEKMYGYSAEEIMGEDIRTIIPDDLKGEENVIIEKARKGGVFKYDDTKRIRKDGTVLDVELSVSPIKDMKGNITSVFVIGRDITEQKRIRDNTERMNKLMVNRELRMIKLKNKITELEEKLKTQ